MAMAMSRFGFAAAGVIAPLFAGLCACGSSSGTNNGSGARDGGPLTGADAMYGDVASPFADASSATGNFAAPDCQGCTFPQMNAPACPMSGAPPIKVLYPPDGVLVPPNMNVMSVQWTPYGSGYKEFEVDFQNGITDTRVVTKCAMQTVDTGQPNQASGGCELQLDPVVWSFLSNANRGGDPVTITVRGTTDGMCAVTSTGSTHLSFAEQDLVGTIYYWKSTISANGVGGQIWSKSFGDQTPEKQITGTGGALAASCNGCHSLSRDGTRMTVYSDDDDSDDEYGDVTGSLIDMGTKMPIGTAYAGRNTGQPPAFSTFSSDHRFYLSSNGLGTPRPTNAFALWNGDTGMQAGTVNLGGSAMDRPTMPDWSPNSTSVVYVLPTKVGSWDPGGGPTGMGARNDDDHVFGGSLYTVAYMGNQQFGTPAPFLMSGGENNYYPSYSPDGQFIIFDRAARDSSVSAIDGCVGRPPQMFCPNDSFSNPAARLMLMLATGGTPVDLEAANGSPTASPVPLSNSWPRWSPFVQTYRGKNLLWVAFSSTRDYGLRVRNHKSGMYQCYPADSFEEPGTQHRMPFAPECQQPQLWMAPINLDETSKMDPSRVAFWLPFQDITTHNHTPQWTQETSNPVPPPPTCLPVGGNCQNNPAACCSRSCNANGMCQSVIM